jgi:hypothetical protein
VRASGQPVLTSGGVQLGEELFQASGGRAWLTRNSHLTGTVIDRVSGLDNAWLTSGHYRTGILMAPATAQMITRWITASNPPPEAGPWSSTRFG